jgi:hypothetical protein
MIMLARGAKVLPPADLLAHPRKAPARSHAACSGGSTVLGWRNHGTRPASGLAFDLHSLTQMSNNLK